MKELTIEETLQLAQIFVMNLYYQACSSMKGFWAVITCHDVVIDRKYYYQIVQGGDIPKSYDFRASLLYAITRSIIPPKFKFTIKMNNSGQPQLNVQKEIIQCNCQFNELCLPTTIVDNNIQMSKVCCKDIAQKRE